MGILLWIVLGAVAGWIASAIMNTGHSLLMDIMLGIVGAVVGGLIMNMLGTPGVTGFNLYSIVVAVIGAAAVIWLSSRFYRA